MIKVQNMTFSYPGTRRNIFENCSFVIDTDWKLGFVGRNGRGKTTFLNLLQQQYEFSGRIVSSVKFESFPFAIADKSRQTYEILSAISPFSQE